VNLIGGKAIIEIRCRFLSNQKLENDSRRNGPIAINVPRFFLLVESLISVRLGSVATTQLNMTLTHTQRVALAISPKITSVLSATASVWIISEVLSNPRKRDKVYHRIMLASACIDVFASLGCFASTWPIPKDVEGAVWNIGNDFTCNFQGFLIQLGCTCFVYVSAAAKALCPSALFFLSNVLPTECFAYRLFRFVCQLQSQGSNLEGV